MSAGMAVEIIAISLKKTKGCCEWKIKDGNFDRTLVNRMNGKNKYTVDTSCFAFIA